MSNAPRAGLFAAAFFAILAVMLPACSRAPRTIVLVTVSGLRAEALAQAPHVSAPAGKRIAIVVPSPDTVLAASALMTGQDPDAMGLAYGDLARLPAKQPTLAERLAERGWHNAAFVGDPALTARSGLARGFEAWNAPASSGSIAATVEEMGRVGSFGPRPAKDVVDAAVGWLRSNPKGSRFAWIALGDLPAAAANAPSPRDAYAAALRSIDEAVGHLQDGLSADERRSTAIVVVSLGGLALGDQGEILQGLTLAPATIDVTAVASNVRGDIPAGGPRGLPVMTALIAREAGLGDPLPSPGPVLVTTKLTERWYGWPPVAGARVEGGWAWITADPASRDKAPSESRDRLEREGYRFASGIPGDVAARTLASMADVRGMLGHSDVEGARRALGEIASSVPDAAAPRLALLRLPSPKEGKAALIDDLARIAGNDPARVLDAAEAIAAAGEPARARDLLHRLDAAALDPGARLALADALAGAGAIEEATAIAEREATADPGAPELQELLGDLYNRSGNGFRAKNAYLAALAVPRGRTANLAAKLGDALAALGEKDAALQRYAEALRLDPAYRYPHARAAEILIEKKEWGAAAQAIVQSVGPSGDPVRDVIARSRALQARGLLQAAAIELDKGLTTFPANEFLSAELGALLTDAGEPAKARDVLARSLEKHPDRPILHVELARLEALGGQPDRAIAELDRADHGAGPALRERVGEEPLFRQGGPTSALARRAAAFAAAAPHR